MDREEAIRLLESGEEGVRKWNAWRAANLEVMLPHLRKADLRGADLRGADLRGADLGVANLYEANLGGANLRLADGPPTAEVNGP
jgi:hypothetical protein